MFNAKGATMLAYMKGERQPKQIKKVDMSLLTPEQEKQVAQEARETGQTFQECAARILANQTKLEEYENGVNHKELEVSQRKG